jgi:hypothetical protein
MLPSPSSMTMMSPEAAANPARTAFPLPGRVSATTTTSRRRARATSTVASRERPSTMTTSSTYEGIRRKTHGRFIASFNVGITTLTDGFAGGGVVCGRTFGLRFGMDTGLTTQSRILFASTAAFSGPTNPKLDPN